MDILICEETPNLLEALRTMLDNAGLHLKRVYNHQSLDIDSIMSTKFDIVFVEIFKQRVLKIYGAVQNIRESENLRDSYRCSYSKSFCSGNVAVF